MTKIWITSDLHIGHDRDFIYKSRGFDSVEEHDEGLVNNWNSVVSDDDTVYVLGDIMLRHNVGDVGESYGSYGMSFLRRLKGKIIIIRGNHDTEAKIEMYKTSPNVVSAGDAALYLKYPEVGGIQFYLSHYPSLITHENIKPLKTALVNLFGHTHQKEKFYQGNPYMYCVCLDAHDMKPVLLDDIIEDIRHQKSLNNY